MSTFYNTRSVLNVILYIFLIIGTCERSADIIRHRQRHKHIYLLLGDIAFYPIRRQLLGNSCGGPMVQGTGTRWVWFELFPWQV
jgi:hypothetical protein